MGCDGLFGKSCQSRSWEDLHDTDLRELKSTGLAAGNVPGVWQSSSRKTAAWQVESALQCKSLCPGPEHTGTAVMFSDPQLLERIDERHLSCKKSDAQFLADLDQTLAKSQYRTLAHPHHCVSLVVVLAEAEAYKQHWGDSRVSRGAASQCNRPW